MDMNVDYLAPGTELTQDEMFMLRDAGVKTIYYQAGIRWDRMQPAPNEPVDWSNVDRWVEKGRKAGLKMLIPPVFSFPRWLPNEFFLSHEYDRDSDAFGVPNYTNPDALDTMVDWVSNVIFRYAAEDVQVIYSMPINGEFVTELYPRTPYIPFDVQVLIDWNVKIQSMLAAQHGEVWTIYNSYINPVWWFDYFTGLREAFPPDKFDHYGYVFTYVQHIGISHVQRCLNFNQDARMIYFGGTEYVQGMRTNVPILKRHGARMLTAPKHPYQGHKAVNEWMQNEIRWALDYYGRV
jgi:hypothetical protein